MFNLFTRLSDKEFRWLDRRSKQKYGVGIPGDVREKIIRLGYGMPEAGNAFKLTPKGVRYLQKRGKPRDSKGAN